MDYNLAKQLKDAGFPQNRKFGYESIIPDGLKYHTAREYLDAEVIIPTLSELIEACGDKFTLLCERQGKWFAESGTGNLMKVFTDYRGHGSTPEEAVAKLWLELKLNKK